MPWVRCQNCGGNGSLLVEVKPGKWERRTCSACEGAGGKHTEVI
jgi:hypothetical protein